MRDNAKLQWWYENRIRNRSKKIRKKLRVYGIPEDERARLREALDHLKSLLKAEKRTLESH